MLNFFALHRPELRRLKFSVVEDLVAESRTDGRKKWCTVQATPLCKTTCQQRVFPPIAAYGMLCDAALSALELQVLWPLAGCWLLFSLLR